MHAPHPRRPTFYFCNFRDETTVSAVSRVQWDYGHLAKWQEKLLPRKTNKFSDSSHKNSKRDDNSKESWIFIFESKKCIDRALATLLLFEPGWVSLSFCENEDSQTSNILSTCNFMILKVFSKALMSLSHNFFSLH